MLTNKVPWIVVLVLWMVGSTWWHVCKVKQLCLDDSKPVDVSTEDSPTPMPIGPFTLSDGSRFKLDLPGNFSFAKSGANANLNSLGGSLDPLITYLKTNPGRTLSITGYYSADETNPTAFPNLGVARAEGLKQYLVQQGLLADSYTTKGEERGLTFTTKGDSLYGGLTLAFSGLSLPEAQPEEAAKPVEPEPATEPKSTELIKLTEPTTEKALAEAQKFTSVFKPIDLYFSLGEANYIKTEDTKKFFDEAIKYLASHKDKKLLLTGHTDNSGPDDVNMRLSRDRANDVKARLRKSGVPADQIQVKAKGETEPKADNSTISGRKANRRVTVVVE